MMKKEKICPICENGKQKRLCNLQHGVLICVSCSLKTQNYACEGCSFYQDKILKFKCATCGKISIDDQPSDITKVMADKVFKLENLGGIKFNYGLVASGETYSTSLAFPFEGKIDKPHWFYYDPEENFHTLHLLQGKIREVRDFDEYRADIGLFVHQSGKCRNVRDILPEKEMPESLYDIDKLFPVGSLRMRTFGNFIQISSITQDGGNWVLICGGAINPRLILYAEGWFNHWQSYIGNIKINKGFIEQIQDRSNAEK